MKPTRDTYLARLRETLDRPFDTSLPLKTQEEQRAGRNRIMVDLRRSVVECGKDELRKRFGNAIREAHLYDVGTWKAEVVVLGSQGSEMRFVDDLLEFPSDEMIAQIALIV